MAMMMEPLLKADLADEDSLINSPANKTILKAHLRRKCYYWFGFKICYEKELAILKLKPNGEAIIEFQSTERKLKHTYEMKNCMGVNLRVELDHARAEWPTDGSVTGECCFIITDVNEKNFLYLIAEEGKVANQWTQKLQQYLPPKARRVIRPNSKKGDLSINDLLDIIDLLTKNGFPPKKWKRLGLILGLSDNTLQTIEEYYHPDFDDCLQEGLSKWLRRYDEVDAKGGATYANLANALCKVGDVDVVARAVEALIKNEGKDETVVEKQAADHDEVQLDDILEQDDEENVWKKAGLTTEYNRAIAISNKNATMRNYMTLVTGHIRSKNGAVGVLAEIAFLSQDKRSSLLKIINETPSPITYIKSYIVKGRTSPGSRLDENIPPNDKNAYSFEKFTNLSLEGCSVMLLFSIDLQYPQQQKCYFLVAFRNNCLQLTRRSRNKAVVLLIDNPVSVADAMNALYFGMIMRNENTKPSVQNIEGSYQGDQFRRTFMAVTTDAQEKDDFGGICFNLSMDDYLHSVIKLKISIPILDLP